MKTRIALSSFASTRVLAMLAATTIASLATGCDRGSSGPTPVASVSTPQVKVEAKGLEAATNDPTLVDLAKKTLVCKWAAFGFDAKCTELRTLLESDAMKDGKGDTTLVNFLDDPNEQVRWLGARSLSQRGRVFRTDKLLAEHIVKVAEGEQVKAVAQELGAVVGGIKHVETGLGERIKAMATGHQVQQMRTSIMSRMLFSNGELLYDFVKDIATNDKDTVVRKAAMSAFWTGSPPTRAAETCKMWLGFMDDPSDEVAGEAAYLTAFYPQSGGCKGEWDAVMDKIEARAKAGTIKSTQLASALTYLHRQAGTSDAQKKRSLAIARLIIENPKNNGMARGRALEFVVEKDTDPKKLLEKLKDDEDTFVKTRAKDLATRSAKKDGDKDKGPADASKPVQTKAATEPNKKPE